MLMPKKIRYRKVQRGTCAGRSKGARQLDFEEYGLQAVVPGWMTAQQIESMRVSLARHLEKCGKFIIRVFPDKPVTKKPAETRMGKGKGGVELWVAVVKRGRVICEIGGVDEATAKKTLRAVCYKLPLKMKFIKRSNEIGTVQGV